MAVLPNLVTLRQQLQSSISQLAPGALAATGRQGLLNLGAGLKDQLNGSLRNAGTALAAQAGKSIISGIFGFGSPGGPGQNSRQTPNNMFQYSTQVQGPKPIVNFPQAEFDWRVRISLAPNSDYFYNDPSNHMLSPLIESESYEESPSRPSKGGRVGVIFPYTPSITIQHTANYSQQKLVHNNYAQYFYENSEVNPININAEFTAQNVSEGRYLLATIYFFRSVTKMFFGQDNNAGNPPPIVYLNGYGKYILPNVPCIVTSFSHIMPDQVDYFDVPTNDDVFDRAGSNPVDLYTRMPTSSTISVTLQPVYSRLSQSQRFSLKNFANGDLINKKGSGMPASGFGTNTSSSAGPGGFI
jgi:hypothetical protein